MSLIRHRHWWNRQALDLATHLLGPGRPAFANLIRTNKNLDPFLRHRRSALIHARANAIAKLFAILTILWIPIDALTMEKSVWLPLAILRGFAGCLFIFVAWFSARQSEEDNPLNSVLLLFTVPIIFFATSNILIELSDGNSLSITVLTAYYYLPFIVVAGLALFPLTVSESILVIISFVGLISLGSNTFDIKGLPNYDLGMTWLLFLIGCIAMIAGTTQLHLLITTTEQSVRDGLTHAYRRDVGE